MILNLKDYCAEIPTGIQATFLVEGWALIVKQPKEQLLTASVQNSIDVYFYFTASEAGWRLPVLLFAFRDNYDEPWLNVVPLYTEEAYLCFKHVLSQPNFTVVLVDAVSGVVSERIGRFEDNDLILWKLDKNKPIFPANPTPDIVSGAFRIAYMQFATRTKENDRFSTVRLESAVEYGGIDAMSFFEPKFKTSRSLVHTTVTREVAGKMHEYDIASVLGRIFGKENVFHSPIRIDTGKELCDVLVVYEDNVIVVQAKDSANILREQEKSIDRMRQTSLKKMKNGISQLGGAFRALDFGKTCEIKIADEKIVLPSAPRRLYGIVVVPEMFDEIARAGLEHLLENESTAHYSSWITDFSTLYNHAFAINNAEDFVDFIDARHLYAIENGQFLHGMVVTDRPNKKRTR